MNAQEALNHVTAARRGYELNLWEKGLEQKTEQCLSAIEEASLKGYRYVDIRADDYAKVIDWGIFEFTRKNKLGEILEKILNARGFRLQFFTKACEDCSYPSIRIFW